jgi:hypothetical protein
VALGQYFGSSLPSLHAKKKRSAEKAKKCFAVQAFLLIFLQLNSGETEALGAP